MKKQTQDTSKRILGRRLAKELTPEQLKAVTGGSWTYTAPFGMDSGDALH